MEELRREWSALMEELRREWSAWTPRQEPRPEPPPANEFEVWLRKQDAFSLPLVAWGPDHTKIALRFAKDYAAQRARRTLDETTARVTLRGR